MLKTVTVREWLEEKDPDRKLLDVRTPAEFDKGHIPQAISFPLFSNEERVFIFKRRKSRSWNTLKASQSRICFPKRIGFCWA